MKASQIIQKRKLLTKSKRYTSKHHMGRTAQQLIESCKKAREKQSQTIREAYKKQIGEKFGEYKLLSVLEQSSKDNKVMGKFECLGCNQTYIRKIAPIKYSKPSGCKSCAAFLREQGK